MNEIQAFIIGLIQGIAEFFPISSSGHLVLIENFYQLNVEKLFFFNILLHLATLIAIFHYYRKDIMQKLKTLLIKGSESQKLFVKLCVATIPAALIGVFFEDFISSVFSTNTAVAGVMAVVGFIFLFDKNKNADNKITIIKALIIGFAQALALIPGVSRSGSTLFVATKLGIDRVKAAQFSFYMAIPVILGATILSFKKMPDSLIEGSDINIILIGFLAATFAGIIAIKYLIKFYHKYTLRIWGVYLITLSLACFYLV